MATDKINLKTETEHMLFKAYADQQTENENLKFIIKELKKEVFELQEQIKILSEKKTIETSDIAVTKDAAQPIDYETDEEELARETEWIRVKSRKKRKLSTSPVHCQHQDNESNNLLKKVKPKKILQPPPIIISGVKDYQAFYDLLRKDQTCHDNFKITTMNDDNIKINASNEDCYRIFSKLLTDYNFLWHSYENKQDRPIRVMAKKLHSTFKPERIIEDLKSKGLKIESAVNKLRWQNKEPLNMFTLSFENSEDVNKIYGIKTILGCKVEIHPLRTSKLIPQCKKCQTYGHTQKYCSREPRCVKCTGKHLSINCKSRANHG